MCTTSDVHNTLHGNNNSNYPHFLQRKQRLGEGKSGAQRAQSPVQTKASPRPWTVRARGSRFSRTRSAHRTLSQPDEAAATGWGLTNNRHCSPRLWGLGVHDGGDATSGMGLLAGSVFPLGPHTPQGAGEPSGVSLYKGTNPTDEGSSPTS